MADLTGTKSWRLCRSNWNFTADGGAVGTFTPFRVTGTVLVQIFGVCTTLLTGATATVELGIAGNTAALIALTTATDIAAYEVWQDATPEANPGLVNVDGTRTFVIANGTDIIQTIATAAVTAGAIDYYCFWRPLSADGLVEAL